MDPRPENKERRKRAPRQNASQRARAYLEVNHPILDLPKHDPRQQPALWRQQLTAVLPSHHHTERRTISCPSV